MKTKFFFSVRVFFHGQRQLTGQLGKGRDHICIPFYHFHPLTNIQTFICNFACEMIITYFNRTTCIYQTATQWDLPPYRITIWLIDDVKLVFVCLLDDLILGFCFSNLNTGNRLTQTRIDYHPCISSKPTNQVR